MKTHVENSTKMIRYLPDMDYVIPAVVGHHERYDGTGYPRGLAGQNIPYMARILTIADCFDAMTAKRPYKQALSVEYAVNELEKTAVRNLILCLSKNLWSSSMKEKFRLHNRSLTSVVLQILRCFYRV